MTTPCVTSLTHIWAHLRMWEKSRGQTMPQTPTVRNEDVAPIRTLICQFEQSLESCPVSQ